MSDKSDGITFHIGRVQVWLHFEPRDFWVGVFWDRDEYVNEVYVCPLPMLCIRFLWMVTKSEVSPLWDEDTR